MPVLGRVARAVGRRARLESEVYPHEGSAGAVAVGTKSKRKAAGREDPGLPPGRAGDGARPVPAAASRGRRESRRRRGRPPRPGALAAGDGARAEVRRGERPRPARREGQRRPRPGRRPGPDLRLVPVDHPLRPHRVLAARGRRARGAGGLDPLARRHAAAGPRLQRPARGQQPRRDHRDRPPAHHQRPRAVPARAPRVAVDPAHPVRRECARASPVRSSPWASESDSSSSAATGPAATPITTWTC